MVCYYVIILKVSPVFERFISIMNIKVNYFGFFEDLLAQKEETIELYSDNSCVVDLFNLLSQKYGAKFKNIVMDSEKNQLKEGFILLLNDIKGNLNQRLKDGDVISLLPILAGG